MTPHLSEEIWSRIGNSDVLIKQEWPSWNEKILIEEDLILPIQVNGKKKAEMSVKRSLSRIEIEDLVLKNKKVQTYLNGAEPRKIIVVPGRIVNVVV
tara:strand:- start:363 stop:653 length:291 start_codon:yes stop_codon:yes gene_type:complete